MNYTGQTLLMAKLNDLTKPCELTKPHELVGKKPICSVKSL